MGLTTAAVSWPASTGAEIDWNVPEIRDISPRRLPIWEITAQTLTVDGGRMDYLNYSV